MAYYEYTRLQKITGMPEKYSKSLALMHPMFNYWIWVLIFYYIIKFHSGKYWIHKKTESSFPIINSLACYAPWAPWPGQDQQKHILMYTKIHNTFQLDARKMTSEKNCWIRLDLWISSIPLLPFLMSGFVEPHNNDTKKSQNALPKKYIKN